MERDFMGLNSKDSVIVVKEETVETCRDSVFSKASAIQWPCSNKVSALPHFMSFKSAQEEKTVKVVSDSLASSGFMAISTADAFDTTQKRQSADNQKNINHDRQGGTHFSMSAYPMQQNVHSGPLPHDVKMLPVSSQAIPVSTSNPFFKTHFAFMGANMQQQFLGGIPVTTPHSILPSSGSIVGTTESWINSKPSGALAPLTIFYGGTVNVYDDISLEKAQAIMLLAGNGFSAPNVIQPRAQVQAPTSKVAAGEVAFVNQPVNKTSPYSGLSSPMSVSSHPIDQSGGGSTNNDEGMATKSSGVTTTPVSKVDSPNILTSLGPVAATSIMPSAVPQARKASLVRFLEKRKERAMNSAPYNLSKKSPECNTRDSNGVGFSATSGVGSGPISAGK